MEIDGAVAEADVSGCHIGLRALLDNLFGRVCELNKSTHGARLVKGIHAWYCLVSNHV